MGGGGDFGSGLGSKFNCAARVGSGQTISGTGRVRASVLSPCRPLHSRPGLLWGVCYLPEASVCSLISVVHRGRTVIV